jgi:hypothetical protein
MAFYRNRQIKYINQDSKDFGTYKENFMNSRFRLVCFQGFVWATTIGTIKWAFGCTLSTIDCGKIK